MISLILAIGLNTIALLFIAEVIRRELARIADALEKANTNRPR